MADTKISGLPASTTPLAGTEVLPIVQSSATKQVSVANLTAGRDVSANTFSSAAGAVATPAITTAGDTNTGFWFPAADTIAASTAGTEGMRIDSTGAVGIGTTSLGASYGLRVSKTFAGDNGSNIFSSATGTASTPTAVYSFRSTVFTGANGGTPYTISSLYGYSAAQSTFSADSTVTNQYGFLAASSLTGATNNYGFYGAIASGTGRYNFYAAGTADNYFAGNVGIGRAPPTVALDIFTATPQIKLQGTGTSAEVRVLANYGSADLGAIGTVGSSPFMLFTFNTERMRIGSTGTTSIGGAVGAESLRVTPVASAVNYLEVVGAITTASPAIQAAGSDTNIDLTLTSKGTGNVRFGTLTANADAPITGYITIKDSGGTARKLAIIA